MTTVLIPLRTVSEANARIHWAERARRAKVQREAARIFVRAARGGEDDFSMQLVLVGHAEIRLARIAPKDLDSDNLAVALKAVRDGVADALGVDDGDPRIAWQYAQRRGGPAEYAVEVEIP